MEQLIGPRVFSVHEEEETGQDWAASRMTNALALLCSLSVFKRQTVSFPMYLMKHNAEPGAGPVVKMLRGHMCRDEDGEARIHGADCFYFCCVFLFDLIVFQK